MEQGYSYKFGAISPRYKQYQLKVTTAWRQLVKIGRGNGYFKYGTATQNPKEHKELRTHDITKKIPVVLKESNSKTQNAVIYLISYFKETQQPTVKHRTVIHEVRKRYLNKMRNLTKVSQS